MWTQPTLTDVAPGVWETVRENDVFLAQRERAQTGLFRNVVTTVQHVFDTKQAPFRILIKRHNDTERAHLVAVADTPKALDKDWAWIDDVLMKDLAELEEPWDREAFAVSKFQSLVQAGAADGGDETVDDPKFRAAARAWRQTFHPAAGERLVNFYSCAYGKAVNQGWMYVTPSFVYFYAFVFGAETKVAIELRDIEEIKKANSKRGLVADAIRVVTREPRAEHVFVNLFHRDEVYDLIQHLTNAAMQRMLQHAFGAGNDRASDAEGPVARRAPQLREQVAQQQRDARFQAAFSLPGSERLLGQCRCIVSLPATGQMAAGTLSLGTSLLCFASEQRFQLNAQIPYYAIKRVERVPAADEADGPALAVTVWHQMQLVLELLAGGDGQRAAVAQALRVLKTQLLEHVPQMRALRGFLAECASERLLVDRPVELRALGARFGYVDDAESAAQKLGHWKRYMQTYGRNLTLVRLPTFVKLVRVGLPSALRGEVWELCSGAVYRRYARGGYYDTLHAEHRGETSVATEEIEKDLNRSLPEYRAYQTPEGIEALRRVLYAYAFHDPGVGYCQAMNLVASALLIYASEEQAFWIMCALSEYLLPGYYAVNMAGAMLDIQVFETLVARSAPILTEHFAKHEIQLSISVLPWFMSIYVNTLPLVFALRVMDCFFLEGPKVLFQVGLAILKTNGDAVLAAHDDGELMAVLRRYLAALTPPAHPQADAAPATARFHRLMLTAYRDFQNVTNELVMELRRSHQPKVVLGLDTYAKRGIIRNLRDPGRFSREQLLFMCDQYYAVMFYGTLAPKRAAAAPDSAAQRSSAVEHMPLPAFRQFLARITTWADIQRELQDFCAREGLADPSAAQLDLAVPGSRLLDRLFAQLDAAGPAAGVLTFQDLVTGLGRYVFADTTTVLGLFFRAHDSDADGFLSRDDALALSESMLFLMRHDEGDARLAAVSDWIHRALAEPASLSLPRFRELVLANAYLLEFFEQRFRASFILSKADAEVFRANGVATRSSVVARSPSPPRPASPPQPNAAAAGSASVVDLLTGDEPLGATSTSVPLLDIGDLATEAAEAAEAPVGRTRSSSVESSRSLATPSFNVASLPMTPATPGANRSVRPAAESAWDLFATAAPDATAAAPLPAAEKLGLPLVDDMLDELRLADAGADAWSAAGGVPVKSRTSSDLDDFLQQLEKQIQTQVPVASSVPPP